MTRNGRVHRPIGRLWAWLDAGHLFDTAEQHKKHAPDFAARVAARAEVEALPEVQDFLQHESGGPGAGEPVHSA